MNVEKLFQWTSILLQSQNGQSYYPRIHDIPGLVLGHLVWLQFLVQEVRAYLESPIKSLAERIPEQLHNVQQLK